ncbi:Tubulin-like protein [Anatilimnocola aggregata]|uniref:Tubulin-like protein n=1 Tax=Anatilimnocola aggregata TaxID=2528021 RepID=A0A517Y7X9_9BACT|nr:tubulin-like doman-containing protein [Anatilimnocola aggregata]QDU26326.1 Tubulin-like protein [Anatilimnocola aggregata]
MPAVLRKASEPIPGYRLVQRVGAGGYGEVWTAEAPGGLIKAIKFVYGLLDEDRGSREMKALQRIKGVRHPFLLSIERIEIIDGQLIFVTELADNSLKDRFDQCRKEGRPGIPRDELLQHLRDTADALDYMNEHHTLQHLDVKPENLLLVGGRVKVADFGLVKDLHEAAASMMGGLTPIYAPPEVFEGRPTKFSDQYSLAIVYQEMLSGVLPFPGKTAAQLAAQHLNARPRMAALPEADQQVIGRSLSKNPNERFANCREMVAALNKATQQIVAARMTHARSELMNEMGRHITQGATQAHNAAPATHQPAAPETPLPPLSYATEAARTPDQMLASLDEASQQADSIQEDNRLVASADDLHVDLKQRLQTTDVPPPEFDVLNWSPQPTLLIGLGGIGGKVLGRLKQIFAETPHGAPLQTLVLDSDRRESLENCPSSPGTTFRPDDFMHLPLRRSSDYRDDSRRMLEWLGRRWLYNIPRSQQTEGLRPLGRLAMVDHADEIWKSFRTSLQRLARPIPGSDQPQTPRVIVVAGSGGGTGSGMVIDIVVGLQQLFDELKLNASDLSVVLAHTTPRTAAGVQLATANTCALLAEWQHQLRAGGQFPGDPACGLTPRTIDRPPRTRLIHMGEELSNEDFDTACDSLADLIALEVSTPVDNFFRATAAADLVKSSASTQAQFRTSGLVRVGFTRDDLAARAVRHLCFSLVERWLGKPKSQESIRASSAAKSTNILPSRQTQSGTDCRMKEAFLDLQAQKQATAWGLDTETLIKQLIEFAGSQLGGNPDSFFQELTQTLAKEAGTASPVQRWLATTTELFGPRTSEAVAPGQEKGVPALVQATEAALKERINALSATLKAWLLHYLDDPQHRLYASQKSLGWFQAHCRSMLDQLRDVRRRIAQETGSLEQYLVALPTDWKKAKASVKKAQGPDPDHAFQQFCRLRLQDFAAQLAGKIVQAMQGTLSSAGDLLVDLHRELQFLASVFDDQEESGAVPATPALLGQLRKLVSDQLKAADAEQSTALDDQLTRTVLLPAGGMLSALIGGGDGRTRLLAQLERDSRTLVLRQLESLDIAAVLAEGAAIDPQLAADWRTLVEQAQPRWQGTAAERRFLCVLPERSQASRDPQLWQKSLQSTSFREAPALVDAPGADLLLCFDLGPLTTNDVLAQLLLERPDLGEVAGRLHTRADVSWPEIVPA